MPTKEPTFELITCPVCNQTVTTPAVARFTSQQAANHFCTPARDASRNVAYRQVIEDLWKRDFAEIYTCEHCTHGFAWPYAGGDSRFYNLMHQNAGYPTMRWEYEAFVKALSPGATGKHLDIGTGDGSFLKLIPSTWERCATESTDVLREQLKAKGIHTFASLEEAVAQASHTFDSVTMFQVIEHIADFRPMLAGIRALLKPGGRVGLSVPHGGFKTTQERLTHCADMPPNHVNRWTPKSLSLALEQTGFTQVEPILQKVNKFGALKSQAALKTLGVAVNKPRSLTAQFYRIKSRPMRQALFSLSGGVQILTLLPYLGEIAQPQEFLCAARAPEAD